MKMNTRPVCFTNKRIHEGRSEVCLELTVSVNEQEENVHRVNKPVSALFQSNDAIEEMVADEVVAFSFG
jgi:hypothetical protein